ncbi:MAG TPA: redox-regulated ATPase YchF [Candidatus Nanoarchaeia archaeon]|nr:redox-regulated ATPase YchF [Candidatus Nanoarchaeia archaeon]
MSISIGLAGKPNSGKSTFFKAATLAEVDIANHPFTTIDANHGVAYVRTLCACQGLGKLCGQCKDGARYVPVDIIDVAGLVPDAHKGRGLGNAFLDNLRQASAIIHVIDASGGTDIEGNPVGIGQHDPLEDIEFLEYEITMWMFSILKRNWDRLSRKIQAEGLKIEHVISDQLQGAGVSVVHARRGLQKTHLISENPAIWTDDQMIALSDAIRLESKPLIIAANKMDVAPPELIERLRSADRIVVPTSAAAELALRMAQKSGVIDYRPGDKEFKITGELSEQQKGGLDKIKMLLDENGGTGIQECINTTVLKLLDQIVLYPVEDEAKYTDKNGKMLPDAYLMKKGSTPHDLAYMVHTDIGEGFLYAVNAKTKMRLGEKHDVEDGDVIKIVSTK